VGEVFQDDAEVIDQPWFNRPAGGELLSSLGQGDTVVIPCGSMVWTTPGEVAAALARAFAAGVNIAFVDRNLMLTPPNAEAVAKGLECYALMKWNTRSVGTRIGMADRKRQGLRWSRIPPAGMKWVGRKGRQRLVPDPKSVELAEKVRQWWSKGYSWHSIAAHLNQHGVVRRGGRPWNSDALRRLLGARK
jgi:hypothetical protein